MPKEATQKTGLAVGLNKGHVSLPSLSCFENPSQMEKQDEIRWTGLGSFFTLSEGTFHKETEKDSFQPLQRIYLSRSCRGFLSRR